MPKLDPKEILRRVEEKAFEEVWVETARLLRLEGRGLEWRRDKGKAHPIMEAIWRIRRIMLSYGFEEIINPSIVEEAEVYRQYGPEAPIILDRIFYLAGLPRPDVGLDKRRIIEIRKIDPKFSNGKIKELQRIFRQYKEGEIEGDNLVEEIVDRLNIGPEHATAILGFFPELTSLTPTPSKLTLRSHMTALWFSVLAALQDKKPLPVKLFSVGAKFRREQKLDEMHLYESYVASTVVMSEDVTLQDGVELTRTILSELGFKDARFEVKKATSKYYAPKTEMEVFVKAGDIWVEVGDIGLYSPVSLARYGIRYPVFNAGIGIERIVMLLEGVGDIRKIAYPQFYLEVEYSDEQLGKMIRIREAPTTEDGRRLLDAIVQTAIKHAIESSPCEFLAYRGPFLNRKLEVYVYEPDAGTKLIGPAAFNVIYVYDGNVLGVPERGLDNAKIVREAREKGLAVGIRYLDAVASLAAARIEKEVRLGKKGEFSVRIRMAKQPSDVNIEVNDVAQRYVTSERKVIDVRGPVFVGVKAKISS